MLPTARLPAFAMVALVFVAIPGPSVLFVVSRAVALGRRAALTTVAGNAAGVYLQVLLVAAGVGVIVERSVVAFNVVKLAGAAYLAWLGIGAIRSRRSLPGALAAGAAVRPARALFVDGLVVGAANPKAIVFFAAVLPQFVDPAGGPAGLQMAVLGLVCVAIALLSDSAWGLAAGAAREWFVRSPRRLERIGGASGLVMVGLGIRLATTGRRD